MQDWTLGLVSVHRRPGVGRLLAILTLVISVASAEGDAWRSERDRDGVQMYTRPVPNWSIREIRGVEKIDAPLSSVVAVLTDIEASRQLSDVIAEAKVVRRESDTRYRYYSAMDLPWPVSDRDAVYQRQIKQDEQTLAVTLEDTAVEDASMPPRKGFVRIVKSRQTWTLTPAGSETTVELRVLVDPNGPIPPAIINMMSIDRPFKMLVKLNKLARSPRYADAKIDFIRQPPGDKAAGASR